MFKRGSSDPNNNDRLVAIRQDGDVIIDENVRQELGLVISDRYRMAVRNDRMASWVEWLRADSPPVAQGTSFFLAEEPVHPTEDAVIMNRVRVSLYNLATLGKTQLQVSRENATRALKAILMGSVAVTFVLVFAVVPMCQDPTIVLQNGQEVTLP